MRVQATHAIVLFLTCAAVALAGLLMGASTAVVVATVVTLGLLALTVLLRRG